MPATVRPASPNNDPPFVHAPYENNPHNPLNIRVYDPNVWPQPYVYRFPPNYGPIPPLPAAHQVWILDCKSCGTFLTNRGMKGVLLLLPDVSLYSTDALPINCSAYSTNPDALKPSLSRPRSDSRTCECLTQTLCCHGCGSAVGYMIVIPCSRCTSSMTASNRSTNGHRFIFHSTEVVGTERHFVPGEPGVILCDPPQNSSTPGFYPGWHSQAPAQRRPNGSSREDNIALTIPGELDSSRGSRQLQQARGSGLRRVETAVSTTMDVKESGRPRDLEPGDLLFWHHLSRHGEIPGVADDVRARGQASLNESSRDLTGFDR